MHMDVKQAIAERRARRAFDGRPISRENINELIEAMRLSPSCFNSQPWRVVIVSGEEGLTKVKASLTKGNVWATRAPMIMAICSKPDDDCRMNEGRDMYMFDCGMAVGEMMLRATELGFIAHPIGGYNPVMAKEALGIPKEYVLITLVICGYSGLDTSLLSEHQLIDEKVRPERRPQGELFFDDAWGRPFV